MSSYKRTGGSPILGQPSRTYYQVLEISPEEQDSTVIEEAALRCSTQARALQLTREAEATMLLNEIAEALNTLLDPSQRLEYDRRVGQSSASEEPIRQLDGRNSQGRMSGSEPQPQLPAVSRLFRIDFEQTCDVRLVYRGRAI